jgi:formate-dependent nitrite reductase membrane component NrfD
MVDYTPQKEWVEGIGKVLWLAFFFSEVGAGIYFISLFVGNERGYVLGWITTIILGGTLHLAYLGRPLKAWRALLKPKTSELSRGMIVTVSYLVIGGLHLAPMVPVLGWIPWDTETIFLRLLMGMLSFLVILHGFLNMSAFPAIPFWNTTVLGLFSISSGLWIGSQVSIGIGLVFDNSQLLQSLEVWSRCSLFAYIVIGGAFLWNAGHGNATMRYSLRSLWYGKLSLMLSVGVLVIGICVPVFITLLIFSGVSSGGLVLLRLVCAIAGDLIVRYSVLKAGVYTPLLSK